MQHDAAHEWFAGEGRHSWASCPLTENGVLRIVGHAHYPNSPGAPAAVAPLLVELCRLPGHEFWPDDISLLNVDLADTTRLLNSSQVTDSYLLALARARARVHDGRLATFDCRLITIAVPGGAEALFPIGAFTPD